MLTVEHPAVTEFRIFLTGSHGKLCAHRSDDTDALLGVASDPEWPGQLSVEVPSEQRAGSGPGPNIPISLCELIPISDS
jgi:hypothetical protein